MPANPTVKAPSLNQLTGIRAFAALAVVAFHLDSLIRNLPNVAFAGFGGLQPFIDSGYLGVDLFFILSGFIISYVYQQKLQNFSPVESARFILLRLARLYPLHLTMLFVYLGLYICTRFILHAPIDAERFSLTGFVSNLLCVHSWGFLETTTWNIPAWSVSCEWFVYLLFPLAAPFLGRLQSKRGNALIIVAAGVSLAMLKYRLGTPTIGWTSDYGLCRLVPEFIMGCAYYNLYKLAPEKHWTFNAITTLLLVAMIFNTASLGSDITTVYCLGGLIYGLSRSDSKFNRIFNNPVTQYFGEISYSIYMTHACIFSFLFLFLSRHPVDTFSGWHLAVFMIGAMALVSLISIATYYWIEQPARRVLTSFFMLALSHEALKTGIKTRFRGSIQRFGLTTMDVTNAQRSHANANASSDGQSG